MEYFLWQIPFAYTTDHKEQIDKAEEEERLQKEKEEKQKKESEEKANEAKDKADEDTEHRNEAEKHSDIEDNTLENNHDKIENLEGSPADQVWLQLPLRLQNLTVQS